MRRVWTLQEGRLASRLYVEIYLCHFQRQLKVRTWVGKAEMGDELRMGTEERYTLNEEFQQEEAFCVD